MKLIIASNNAHKLVEIKAILKDYFEEILSMKEAGIDHETVEDGTTFMENAIKKAREIAEISGCCALADDSGICVDALGGEPGIYSARYAARCRFAGDHDDEGNNQALLKNLESVPAEQRTGAFVCAIGCVFPDGRELTVRGEACGRILESYHGNGGFGYDPLFFYEPLGKTFAELSAEEKNAVSHRGRAIEAFANALKENFNEV
jgi:XTP/dITP diphosphohydrolase